MSHYERGSLNATIASKHLSDLSEERIFILINQRMLPSICKIKAAFRYSLSVLKIYSIHNMHYRFSVLAVNIGTHPKKTVAYIHLTNSQ